MKQVCFLLIGDTVIDIANPNRVYEVVNIKKHKNGVWITLQNVVTKSTYSAYENTLINESSTLLGYRQQTEIEELKCYQI